MSKNEVVGVALIRLWLLAGLGVGLTTACSSWPSSPPVSYIDAQYRLKKIEQNVQAQATDSPGVRAYQVALSQTLASHCRYLPSDSRYHVLLAKKCGPVTATFKSMSRFLQEYDAPKLGRSLIFAGQTVYYEDLPNECRWL